MSELGADRADIEGGGVVDVRESVVTGGESVVGVIDRVGGSVVDIGGSLLVDGGWLGSLSSSLSASLMKKDAELVTPSLLFGISCI